MRAPSFSSFARELFRRTRHKHTLSSNDLRDQGWDKLVSHPNQIGSFFRYLGSEGLIEKVGHETALHKSAKGREIKTYKWTHKAWSRLCR